MLKDLFVIGAFLSGWQRSFFSLNLWSTFMTRAKMVIADLDSPKSNLFTLIIRKVAVKVLNHFCYVVRIVIQNK